MKGCNIIRKWVVVLMVLSITFIVVGCLEKEREKGENDYTVLIMLFDELYYIPDTVDESTYTLNETIGKITSAVSIEETPKKNFSTNENTFKNLDVYTIKEKENVYVVPYDTERHGTRYYVLDKFDGD